MKTFKSKFEYQWKVIATGQKTKIKWGNNHFLAANDILTLYKSKGYTEQTSCKVGINSYIFKVSRIHKYGTKHKALLVIRLKNKRPFVYSQKRSS